MYRATATRHQIDSTNPKGHAPETKPYTLDSAQPAANARTKNVGQAKQITCRDAGIDCPRQFKVETEDQLMQHLQIHGKVAHPDIPMDPEFLRQVKSLIKTI